jgi:hypothetical protein
MKQDCTVCNHAERLGIEAALGERHSYRKIAAEFEGVSIAGLSRHRSHMVPNSLPADAADGPDGLLQSIDVGIIELRKLGERLKRGKNIAQSVKLAIQVSREVRSLIAMRAQVLSKQPIIPPVATGKHESSSAGDADPDIHEVARLIAELTNNFDPAEIEKLKKLAAEGQGAMHGQ